MNFAGSVNYRYRPQLKDLPAAPGDSVVFQIVSVGPLSAVRVLAVGSSGVELADKDTLTQQDKILGLTITSSSIAGEAVDVLGEGYSVDPTYGFTAGPLWLGNAGVITQVKPTSGMLVQLGVAISATEIYFDIGLAIKLA